MVLYGGMILIEVCEFVCMLIFGLIGGMVGVCYLGVEFGIGNIVCLDIGGMFFDFGFIIGGEFIIKM